MVINLRNYLPKKKYVLTSEEIYVDNYVLYRIKACRKFNDVRAGDLGGFIEYKSNLDNRDTCWVYKDAKVYGNAQITGNASGI